MAPPYEYLVNTGVIVPDTSTILSEVQTEFQTALGSDLVVTPDTPQGVLITAEALARVEEVNNNAALANQINPNIAGGVFLDAILALTGTQRTPATSTIVSAVTVTGVAGAVIPAGSQAATGSGDLFQTASMVTIGMGGTATVDFESVESGPISCAANTLTTVVTSVLGWETVTNPTAGVPGSLTQSDQQTRVFRKNTMAFQGVSLPAAITSALYAVPGVTSLAFLENVSNITQVIEGVTMTSHSVYVCVRGGTNAAVAAALLENKSSGSSWNGGTSVTITEPASGQDYTVLFDRPEEVGILIIVTTTNGNTENIKNAVLDFAAGLVDGFDGFQVGQDVSAFEIAGGITCQYPSYYISNVQISRTSPVSYGTAPIVINKDQVAVTQSSNITVVIT